MAPSPEEEAPEDVSQAPSEAPYAYTRDDPEAAIGAHGARSGLSLGGTQPLAKAPTVQPLPPRRTPTERLSTERLEAGVTRAKHMSVALGMIAVLMLQILVQRILLVRLRQGFALLKLRALRLYYAFGILLKPHLARMRAQAKQTQNQAVRAGLLTLLAIVAPVERSAMQVAKTAKLESARLADGGARVTLKVLLPLVSAVGQLVKTGFNQAAVQRIVARLIQLTAEPPK